MSKRLPMDTRLVREIQSDPIKRAEQGSGFLKDFGGPEAYLVSSGMPVNARLVYDAIQDGVGEIPDLLVVTGLSEADINSAISYLKGQDLVQEENPTNE